MFLNLFLPRHLESVIGRVLTERLLYVREHWKVTEYTFPRLMVEFVDMNSITEKYRDKINLLKKHFSGQSELYKQKSSTTSRRNSCDAMGGVPEPRYSQDLFYLSPLYPLVFPHLSRLILLDADLLFHTSLEQLWRHFNLFSSQQVVSFAPDLSPHYRNMLHQYRQEHRGTPVGEPGEKQVTTRGRQYVNKTRGL